MRKLLLAAALMSMAPTGAAAAPCMPDPLSAYTAPGFSCEIGGATFSDFSLSTLDPFAMLIPDIQVSPFALGLDFGIDVQALSGEVFDALIGYTLSGPSIAANSLSMTGSAVDPGGSVSAIEEKCIGGTFAGDNPFTPCSGTTLFPPLVVADVGGGPGPPDQALFMPASFFDVFTQITIDGTFAPASLAGAVRNEFTAAAVPEPSALLLVSSGVLAALGRRRYRRLR